MDRRHLLVGALALAPQLRDVVERQLQLALQLLARRTLAAKGRGAGGEGSKGEREQGGGRAGQGWARLH